MNYLIDDFDRDLLVVCRWAVNGRGYIYGKNGKYRDQCLHRVIAERMGLDLSKLIDHIDCGKENNCRSNLREATRSQNNANSKIRSDNTSGFKGVYWNKEQHKWKSQIGVNKKRIHLGYFNTPEGAYKAYCQAADKYFGEFANHG